MATETSLELRVDNPYATGSVFTFDEGDSVLDEGEFDYVKSTNDRYFTVVEGDTLWSIAFEAYGSSKWYHIIQKANGIDEAYNINIGDSLLIPDIENTKTNN